MRRSPEERFYSKVQVNNQTGCWEWVGSRTSDGYGQFRLGDKICATHKVSWEWHNKISITSNIEIDHICRIRNCVNPTHLQIVPRGFNGKQGGLTNGQRQRNRTHCKRGHEFTSENTYIYPDGRRSCLTCKRAQKRDRYQNDFNYRTKQLEYLREYRKRGKSIETR